MYDIGLIGLAVMGENLALNLAANGFRVAVYNRTPDKVTRFLAGRAQGTSCAGATSVAELVQLLKPPRSILLMVKAGEPVDAVIAELTPHLAAGDIIIDGGNSLFTDTQRRCQQLECYGINYLGLGVSGGEQGALTGPSLMPGGSRQAYSQVEPLLTAIAAKVDGAACCAYIGADGAGHYVKMVHNGIEYADMQLICEAYALLKQVAGLTTAELTATFTKWNQGELDSYLMAITADIFKATDELTGQPLVELILDKAGQKGTGKWTVESGLTLGVPVPTLAEAVFARFMSAYKHERLAAATILQGTAAPKLTQRAEFIQAVHDALYAAKICAYAQGFALLTAAGTNYGWELKPGTIARLWRGGCIIRAQFLERIAIAFEQEATPVNLMVAPFFAAELNRVQANWRQVMTIARQFGVALPAFNSALDYYDSYRSELLPANLLQAQRDYFGAHTYERVDRQGTFHTDWQRLKL